LSPNTISARDNLLASYVGLGRFDEAEQVAREMERINPDSLSTHFPRYLFAFMRGDQATMDREVAWAKGKPEEADVTTTLASVAMYYGKLKEAEQLEQRAQEMFKAQGRKENSAQSSMALSIDLVYLQKCPEAKTAAKSALSMLRGQMMMGNAALVFAACDDAGHAQSLLDEMLKLYPKNTILASIVAPMVRAQIERSRGNLDQAVQLLESIRSYDGGIVTGVMCNYMRGQLYLQQRRGNEAAAEFKAITERRGMDHFSPGHALAHLGLARAAVLNGNTAEARKSYQDFFAMWKDADPDLPVLAQAKKEYEQLK
jgi:tetratricopeptide (TPR) repeat protein